MSHSQRLRIADVRDVIQVIREVCEVGGDPRAWRLHLLSELRRILGASLSVCFVHDYPFDPRRFRPRYYVDVGAEPIWDKYREAASLHADPQTPGMMNTIHRVATRSRAQLCSDREWYSSPFFNEVRRPMRVDDSLSSTVPLADGSGFSCVGLTRNLGDLPFCARDRSMLNLVHTELAKLWTDVAPANPDGELPRRQSQTLALLCQGLSEKQI